MLIIESLRLSGGIGLGIGSSEGLSGCCELTVVDDEVHGAISKVVVGLEMLEEVCCTEVFILSIALAL